MERNALSVQSEGRRPTARKRRRWLLLGLALLLLLGGIIATYAWLKVRRANEFARKGDALLQAGKLNDAAVDYRVALQLDPNNYLGLSGAARLASRAERPEALELWQRTLALSRATPQDRQDYADLLLKTNRLNIAEQVIDDLLKKNPDTRTLQLAARYAIKFGDNAKAIEYARIATNRAPQDDSARFQLAELLARSTDAREQTAARQILWDISTRNSSYRTQALEALARAPELEPDERERLLKELSALEPKNVIDDLLGADLQIQIHPEAAPTIYRERTERWSKGSIDQRLALARWLNVHQQAELVLESFPIETTLQNNQLLLSRLDALATLQLWNEIDDVLSRTDVTLEPHVIEAFRARTAQERNAVLDAEVHWNHAISLSVSDSDKLQFVANFAEQSQANAAALKAYEQLARYPEYADLAFRGTQRVSQKSGETSTQRAAMAKIAARSPDDPNAADQLAYLNLLLGEDVDKNFAIAKKLAEQYPNRLSYRVTVALGYLRRHEAASALSQFNAPVPIDWKRTMPGWRAVYAAALLATDRNDEARQIIATIPRERLNAHERALIEPATEPK